MPLDEHEFDLLAERWLQRLEDHLGELDPDDCDASLSMGVMTLEFADGNRFIINSHRAARQIWMAANVQAWHFSYDAQQDRWIDQRSGQDLLPLLTQLVSEKVGYPVEI